MLSFFPEIAILILLLTAVVIFVLNNTRTGFSYSWLIAAMGILLAWPLLFFSRLAIPQLIEIVSWRPELIYPVSLTLISDSISWPFSIALATLALATILTGVVRSSEVWLDWVSILVVTAFGILAVMAGNPLTLILGWAALDLIELIIYMWRVDFGSLREHIAIAFAVRIGGIWLLVLSATLIGMFEITWSFANVSQEASIFLLLAAGFRLGVVYFGGTYRRDFPFSRGLGTIIRLVPAGSSLMLLTRTAEFGVPGYTETFYIAVTLVIAILAGFSWLFASDELDGQSFWILGLTTFSIASAARGLPEASLAWGLAILIPGGLLFLYSVRHRYLKALIILGLIGFSGLPFTPLWNGMSLYSSPNSLLVLLFFVPHAMFLSGYLWQALKKGKKNPEAERWIRLVYPWGLALLPLVYFIIGEWGQYTRIPIDRSPLILLSVSVTLIFAAVIYWGLHKGIKVPANASSIIISIFSLSWLRMLLWTLFRTLDRIFVFLQTVLEGEGGVLWALLLLILILVLITNAGLGGI